MDEHAAEQPEATYRAGKYDGEGGALFKIALWTGVLTVITLGIYRFWARTRIRRYMWSAITPDGAPFEYTGTGLEKFLGFLIAVVVLAVYLGVVQMGLLFFGLQLFGEPTNMAEALAQIAATYITLLAVVPLIFLAQYRGRRYLLSRTRWRGIRFGVEKGAFGYMLRGLGYSLLAVLTLGALLPLATFKLEEYRVNRTWYGDAQMVQGGRWQMLYPVMTHLAIGVGLTVLAGISVAVLQFPVLAIILGPAGYIWAFIGFFSYRVQSFALLARHKRLGEEVSFQAVPETGTVIRHMIVGGIGVGIGAAVAFAIVGGLFAVTVAGLQGGLDPQGLTALQASAFIVPALGYLFALVLIDALALVLIQQPILRHYVETCAVRNAQALDGIRQRGGDDFADADGFADALDVSAGI